MWFGWLIGMLTPVILIASGYWMWKHPPKTINPIVGYRTSRSMKSMDTWKFANRHCGLLYWKTGWGMLIPSAGLLLLLCRRPEAVFLIAAVILGFLQCVGLFVPIFLTERALKREFPDAGVRR